MSCILYIIYSPFKTQVWITELGNTETRYILDIMQALSIWMCIVCLHFTFKGDIWMKCKKVEKAIKLEFFFKQ